MIYLLTAIGLSPDDSSTVHIYTQTIHRTTQNKQYIEQHNNLGEFSSYNNGDCVQQCTVSLSNARVFCAGESNRIFFFYCNGNLKYYNRYDGSEIQCGSQEVNVSALKRPCLFLWPIYVVIFKIKLLGSKH